MQPCQHHNQQRGRGVESLQWYCSDCGAMITAKDWKDEQARLVAEHRGLELYERGGASPGVTPATRIDITPCGRFRMETITVPLAPTEDEMRAARVDPANPLKTQAVLTSRFGLLVYDGERWREP